MIAASPGIAARDGIGLIQCNDLEGEIVANANSGDGSVTQMIVNGAFRADLRAKDLLGVSPSTPAVYAANFRTGSMTFDGDVLAPIETAAPTTNETAPTTDTSIVIHGNLVRSLFALCRTLSPARRLDFFEDSREIPAEYWHLSCGGVCVL